MVDFSPLIGLLVLSIPLFVVSMPFVIGCALLLRKILPKGIFSPPLYLAAGQSVIISISMALYPSGIFNNLFDAFPPYYFVPGIFIYMVGEGAAGSLNDFLFAHSPYQLANTLLLVVIPGLAGIVLGSFKWYMLGRLWMRYSPVLDLYVQKRKKGRAWKGFFQGKSIAEVLQTCPPNSTTISSSQASRSPSGTNI